VFKGFLKVRKRISKFREIHRAEIKRLMYRQVDRRWDAVFVLYVVGIILCIASLQFFFFDDSFARLLAVVFLLLGITFFVCSRKLLRILRKQKNVRAWLKPIDELIVAIISILTVVIDSTEIANGLYLVMFIYSNWRIWKYTRPYWKLYYFRTAREYFGRSKNTDGLFGYGV
jgi:hypothetical protein